MKADEFLKEIEADIDWRVGQFASLKSIPFIYGLNDDHKMIVFTYTVPAIYSLWEGFIVNISHTYIKLINEFNFNVNSLHISLVTHALNTEFKFSEARIHTKSQRTMVEKICSRLNNDFKLPFKVPTQSNVNYKVLNNILDCLNLGRLNCRYEDELNKLLRYRNNIAHGEASMPVSDSLINEFVKLIENLMSEVLLIFMDGIQNERFKVEAVKS